MIMVKEVSVGDLTVATRGFLRSLWEARLRWHAVVLLVSMMGIGAYLGVHSSFTDDSANVILQSEAIAHGHWAFPDAIPGADPEHSDFAAENSSYTPAGFAPIGKHLTYSALVAPIVRVGGSGGLMALSILGTVLAALVSAYLARLYSIGHVRAVFWATGLASPLFFYGFVYTGQAVGAAATAVAMAAALAYLRSGRVWTLAASGVAMAVGVAARNEALIWCAAACIAAPLLARRSVGASGYPGRRIALLVVALLGGSAVARVSDMLLARWTLGTTRPIGNQAAGFVGGNTVTSQLRGAFIAAIGAGQGGDPFSQGNHVVLAVTIAGLALVTVAARMLRNQEPGAIVVAAAVLAAFSFVGRAYLEPTSPVSGLLPAFPLLWGGLWLIGRAEMKSAEARWVAVAGLLFGFGVEATVYSDGGGLQWGGRYFGVALPVILPLIVAATGHRSAEGSGRARRALAVCVVAATAATNWQMLATLNAYHRTGAAALEELAIAAPEASPGIGGKPVVLSTSVALGQLWAAYFEYRMVRASDSADLVALAVRLRAAGVRHIILADGDIRKDEDALVGTYRLLETVPRLPSAGGWTTAVMVAAPS